MANILIVDDSRTSRKILRRILEEAGHTIVGEAVDGEDGYLKYQELKPEVVTLDITMPKMDGLEALRLIRKFDENAVAIMITAAGQKEKMILAIKSGAADFISKPYEGSDVISVIDKCLNA
ncbi:MAG: response regulator [Lachnospiraceae bacterium]|nr:response regulator [Lachnospiraceae bacterium]